MNLIESQISDTLLNIDNIIKLQNQIEQQLIQIRSFQQKKTPQKCNFKQTGFCQYKNKRQYQEDFVHQSDNCIAVFDGHGGQDVAEQLQELFTSFDKNTAFEIQKKVIEMEREMIDDELLFKTTIGSTLCCAVLNNQLEVLNIGDSFFLAQKKELFCTKMHNCQNCDQSEKERLSKYSSKIQNNKVDGNLSVTRAVGDLNYKHFGVSSKGDINFLSVEDLKFCVICSDGAMEKLTVEQIAFLVKNLINCKNELFIENEVVQKCEQNFNQLIEQVQDFKDDCAINDELLLEVALLLMQNNVQKAKLLLIQRKLLISEKATPEIAINEKMNLCKKISCCICQIAFYLGCVDNCSVVIGLVG